MLKHDRIADEIATKFPAYPKDEQDLTFLSLACYDTSESYEAWAHLTGYPPDDPKTHDSYEIVLATYMALWKRLGSREFFTRLDAQKRRLTLLKGVL